MVKQLSEMPLPRKVAWSIAGILMSGNLYFVRDLAETVKSTHELTTRDRAQFTSAIDHLTKEISEVRQSVQGMQDLRIDVAVLKYSFSELKQSMDKKGK